MTGACAQLNIASDARHVQWYWRFVMVTALASHPPMNASAMLVPELGGLATCLSCHTEDATLTNDAVAAGADWRCRRCGQAWDARRLATVAAYGLWLSARGGA